MIKVIEVYNNTENALELLSNIRHMMLQIIQAVSSASAASLTVEPDLVSLQKARKEYEQLMSSFKSTVDWLQHNQLRSEDLEAQSPDYEADIKQQAKLEEESMRVNDQLKRLLNQSYALQFQIEMLFNSSQDVSLS
ncbi:uncharacterized protein B0P05DRAFT_124045 [Gilbertella persicaria]|uniref:uncharacterized protein n=1 Tax=Gilbertella persicaria TaxID=101096 RepID=UPI00221F64F1|nr:uncharacterized protein B0P05DRAFT_124045 [Gilbertella persicaria]KAI8077240.1 hypothetical protein B0P05DRAFT_124045 [Gilbertella persicaria]